MKETPYDTMRSEGNSSVIPEENSMVKPRKSNDNCLRRSTSTVLRSYRATSETVGSDPGFSHHVPLSGVVEDSSGVQSNDPKENLETTLWLPHIPNKIAAFHSD
jgi:hypothetical protein